MRAILAGYALPRMGTHGLPHWARVLETGRRLAAATDGASPDVVTMFAVFHDACRRNEDHDPGHGRRGARLARSLRHLMPALPDRDFDLLLEACEGHTDGRTDAHPSVQVCWDADRLDLGRVAIVPRARRLCTEAARNPELIDWAYERSVRGVVPAFVRDEWLGVGTDGPGGLD